MSNYPGNDPLGTHPMHPPQPQSPYPSATPPQPKKSKTLFWVLGGCGTLLVIGIIVVAGLAWWGYSTARDSLDKPALTAARILAAANPDVEVVSVDETKEEITLKDKKTGETVTITLKDARDGNITFKSDKTGEVSVQARRNGTDGTVEFKSSEGTATFGKGANAQLPSWLPEYPGATVTGVYTSNSSEGVNSSLTFTTSDSIEQVISFYENALQNTGFKVTTNFMKEGGQLANGSLSADRGDNYTRCFVMALSTSSTERNVTLNYQTK